MREMVAFLGEMFDAASKMSSMRPVEEEITAHVRPKAERRIRVIGQGGRNDCL